MPPHHVVRGRYQERIQKIIALEKSGVEPKDRNGISNGQGWRKPENSHENAHTLLPTEVRGLRRRIGINRMVIVLEGDPVLFNQYGVMAVNPESTTREA